MSHQFTIKLEDDLASGVLVEARRDGVAQVEVFRRALTRYFAAAQSRVDREPTLQGPSNGLPLVEWLAARTGRPLPVCRAALRSGRVRVADEVVLGGRFAAADLDAVTIDGDPV